MNTHCLMGHRGIDKRNGTFLNFIPLKNLCVGTLPTHNKNSGVSAKKEALFHGND